MNMSNLNSFLNLSKTACSINGPLDKCSRLKISIQGSSERSHLPILRQGELAKLTSSCVLLPYVLGPESTAVYVVLEVVSDDVRLLQEQTHTMTGVHKADIMAEIRVRSVKKNGVRKALFNDYVNRRAKHLEQRCLNKVYCNIKSKCQLKKPVHSSSTCLLVL